MKIVTTKELIGLLKISDATLYHLAAARKIAAFRVGRSWRFDLDEICRVVTRVNKGRE